ncbi:DNA-directed RNA polymerase subunit beta [Thermodesulfatator atlanticus]|uniref:DNA-directed RNA polymerase subunit beta n=1 Tax=Thermodesulfatator atlanticus TaxID=501497 RepID=UPI0003B3B6BA|nr:DNA-directed RNA polymerase subunit beta [Thermodesulfatator atlanticus]
MSEELTIIPNRARKNFGRVKPLLDVPYLIAIQKESYKRFLQDDVAPEAREEVGIHGALKSVFPITDYTGTCELEFVDYTILPPKYTPDECREKGLTYEAPMRLRVRLLTYDIDPDTGDKSIRDIKEQEIYFGTVPLMTEDGIFIINGTERVVVNQLQRSPGIFFDHDKGKTHASGKVLYFARVIPTRGSWLDFEFDHRDYLYVRIDRRRKFPVTTFLKALGLSTEEILTTFYPIEKYIIAPNRIEKVVDPEILLGQKAYLDIHHPETGEVLLKKGRKITKAALKRIQEAGLETIPVPEEEFLGKVIARDIIDPNTGEVIVSCNTVVDKDVLEKLREAGIEEVECLYMSLQRHTPCVRDTLMLDKAHTQEEALIEIYRRLRPSSPANLEVARAYFQSLFFDPSTYDLSEVGRYKMNKRLGLDIPMNVRVLTKEDILAVLKHLIELKETEGPVDDIDHLGNRRVRSVGELVENQMRVGLVRMERAIRERMTLQDVEALMPNDLINPKPVTSALREFFGQGQLSQFMDQTNPLSMMTHKRRLSALGPGGLTRERAGFEVRDVHHTHYGRICPIETPEGPNIGLIVSLTTYARVNRYGFIETPYRKVVNGKVTNEVVYMSALDEGEHIIAQSTINIDKEGNIIDEMVPARKAGEFIMARREDVNFIDLCPVQIVSVSSSLIPFLEHDDANRALMGSNMQRQAVPLIRTEAPLVGTGMEKYVARDSGFTIIAEADGVVEDLDATRLVVRYESENGNGIPNVKIYKLVKWRKSNQNTTFTQKPIVQVGQRVKKGQVLADGPSTSQGEIALGKNILVAFMPWRGYNFEDSIVISERLVRDDVFTSIHIEEFECVARETKLGREEITRDIPNVSEEALERLDASGIVKIGAYVKPGDILVGKVTPKGETQLSPEEKLLRAIFGEKASDVKDTSLRVPPGIEGIVIDAKVFTRKGIEKDARAKEIEDREIAKLMKDQQDFLEVLRRSTLKRLERHLTGKTAASTIEIRGEVVIEKGQPITKEVLERIPLARIRELAGGKKKDPVVEDILRDYEAKEAEIRKQFEDRINRLKKGDELPPGVLKVVKVFVAMKRKLQPGDKMAGRHGNKGVVSKVVPIEDMPYLPDGTPVDMVLSPLGVPSRMNIGQILETHLGWASHEIGRKVAELAKAYQVEAVKQLLSEIFSPEELEEFLRDKTDEEILAFAATFEDGLPVATPVFDGAKEYQIKKLLSLAGLSETGQSVLYDGKSGEPFREPVTVGYMYMLKLHHLVDDKIHARSTGPYSLITQQPLGGKAQFGGQRLGEMEVWAMEAYGAAYALQEFLTVKSDDVTGRTRMYERIVKGNNFLEAGLPESFKVLVKELQGLCLDVEMIEEE